jgi:hypothetical protein
MNGLAIVAAAVLAVAIGSELALRGTKLQTALGRVLLVWAGIYLPALAALVISGGASPFSFTLFWGGAFLSWFGVRSHIESSILLRMVHLLRGGPMAQATLVAEYLALCGQNARTEELLRGGLAAESAGELVVTAKGKNILAVVEKLR